MRPVQGFVNAPQVVGIDREPREIPAPRVAHTLQGVEVIMDKPRRSKELTNQECDPVLFIVTGELLEVQKLSEWARRIAFDSRKLILEPLRVEE